MTGRDGIILGACGALSVLAYLLIGRPFMADQPMSARQAELAAKDPASMTAAETLARLEQLTIDRPDDPQPHAFIGELLRAQGRDADAVRAYQSALRRDDAFVPALIGMADSFVRLESGEISPRARDLYARAAAVDPEQMRAAFMAGLSHWQAGETAEAEALWGSLQARIAPDDPRAGMVQAWIEAAREAE